MRARNGMADMAWLCAGVAIALGTLYFTLSQPALGTLEGTVVAEETGEPIAKARVRISPTLSSSQRAFRAVRTDAQGRFSFAPLPVGGYEVSATGQARQLANVRAEVNEARATGLCLQLAAQPPGFELIVHQNMFSPDEKVEVVCKGFVLSPTLRVRCYQVDPIALQRGTEGDLRRYLGLGWDQGDVEKLDLTTKPQLTPLPAEDVPITTRDAEGVFYQRVHPALTKPGLYVLSVRADGIQRLTWVAVTNIGLIAKHAGRRVIVYAVDLKSGRPLEGCKLTLFRTGKPPAEATTPRDGLVDVQFPGQAEGNELLIAGRKGTSFAALRVYPDVEETGPYVAYTYTDRPVYRPGDVVQYKTILRRGNAGAYEVPAHRAAKVEVWDDNGNLLQRQQVVASAYGSFGGSVQLPKAASTGRYSLNVYVDDRPYYSSFDVAAYRKPEYEVTVKTGKPWYVRGDRIDATIEARYYFGAPVADARVRYAVRVATAWYDPSEEELEALAPEDEAQYAEDGAILVAGTAMTDATGRARISFGTTPPPRDKQEPEDPYDLEGEYDRWFTIEGTVTDPGRREVTGSARVRVSQGEFSLSAEAYRTVLGDGESTPVTVKALDQDGKPVKGVEVGITGGPCRWVDDAYKHDIVLRQRPVTDDRGEVKTQVTPQQPGEYRLIATALDKRGNRIVRSLYLWVVTEGAGEYAYKYPELELVPDKKLYDEGDVATVLVNTDRVGADALITVEGKGVHRVSTQRLAKRSTTLKIPLRPQYVPGVYVSVSYVRDKEFVTRAKRLPMSTKRRELKVEVKADRETLSPGDPISYEVRTTGPDGKPAPAEVSLGVVNEAIYAVRPEPKPDILGAFYPRIANSVQTDFSFPQVYLSPEDKGGRPAEVRRLFRDTAFWAPSVCTDADGRATIHFKLPDDIGSWRATVKGQTLATAVGSATCNVTARKPLMVRLTLPRFLTHNDRCRIGAVVHNESDKPQRLQVHLETMLSGPTGPSSGGLGPPRGSQADGNPEPDGAGPPTAPPPMPPGTMADCRDFSSRWVTVAPGGRYTFEQDITSHSGLPLDVVGWARTEAGLEDAVRVALPLLPHGRERVDCRSGVVQTKAATTFQFHKDAVLYDGGLTVRLSPSLASSLMGSLSYLATYPYGCTEQTLSSFVPDVVISRALKELGIPNADLQAKLPAMVEAGLLRLYGYQHPDGGWGWWEYDDSEPWMSAYAVHALLQAGKSGFTISQEKLQKGLHYVKQSVMQKRLDECTRGYALYTLAMAGDNKTVSQKLAVDYGPRPVVHDDHALATYALAAFLVGQRQMADDYLDRLWINVQGTTDALHWDSQQGGVWSDTEATAMAMLATCTIRPSESRLAPVARWLMLQRQGDHWYSTRDTAMVLYAMTAYLKLSKELKPDYTASVSLNGTHVRKQRITPASVWQPEAQVSFPPEAFNRGQNTLEIALDRPGVMYYSADLTEYIAQEDIPAVASGARIDVQREYYRLQMRESEGYDLRPSERPVERARYGDTLRCVLTVTSARPQEFMILEDYLPAGCEVVEPDEEDRWFLYDETGTSSIDYLDDKVAVFWRSLPAGTHRITYDLRAALPGDYHVMPAHIYNMYSPQIWGSGAESRLRVK